MPSVKVPTISAHSFTDENSGQSFFWAEIEFGPAEFQKVLGALGEGQLSSQTARRSCPLGAQANGAAIYCRATDQPILALVAGAIAGVRDLALVFF